MCINGSLLECVFKVLLHFVTGLRPAQMSVPQCLSIVRECSQYDEYWYKLLTSKLKGKWQQEKNNQDRT